MDGQKQNNESIRLIEAEIPLVEKIIRDETWYESEKRGCVVKPDDPAVTKRVCEVIKKHSDIIINEAKKSIA